MVQFQKSGILSGFCSKRINVPVMTNWNNMFLADHFYPMTIGQSVKLTQDRFIFVENTNRIQAPWNIKLCIIDLRLS